MATAAETRADPFPGQAVVLYDGDCPFCRRSVAILKKLDWFGRLAFQSARDRDRVPPAEVPLDPARMLEEMHVLTPDRKRAYVGYAAFRWLAWRLPLLDALFVLMTATDSQTSSAAGSTIDSMMSWMLEVGR